MEHENILQQLETLRQDAHTRSKRAGYAFLIIAVISLITWKLFDLNEVLGIGLFLAIVIPGFMLGTSSIKFRKMYHELFVPLLISKIGHDIEYKKDKSLSVNEVNESQLFIEPIEFSGEDYIKGEFDGVSFVSSDITMKKEVITKDDEGNEKKENKVFFSGRFFIYDFNKSFNGMIQVRENTFDARRIPNMKFIELEDVEFNDTFRTYANNEHDAFYVLTPSLMERMKRIEKDNPGGLSFSFIGSKLYIALENGGLFNTPSLSEPIDDAFVQKQAKEILILKDIVHELKLNSKLFK